MAEEPSRSITDSVRLWLQAVAIPLVLAVAGLWQFVLKEVWWPAAAINLTAEVTIKEAGIRAANPNGSKRLEAIELLVTARNPSSSTVYLLANYWAATGHAISAPQQGSEKSDNWLEGLTNKINNKELPSAVSKHSEDVEITWIAGGKIFADSYLRPNEKVSATFVFHVPQGLYDSVDVVVNLPSMSREHPVRHGTPALGIDYKLNSDRSDFDVASVYRLASNGDRGEVLTTDPQGTLSQRDKEYYGTQWAVARVELSLWEGKHQPSTTTASPETSSP